MTTKRKATPTFAVSKSGVLQAKEAVQRAEAQHPELVRFAKMMAEVTSTMEKRYGYGVVRVLLAAVGEAEKKFPLTDKQLVVEKLIEYARHVVIDFQEERILGNQRGTSSLKLLAAAVNKLL